MTVPLPVDVADAPAPRKAATHSSGWFVRITVAVVVLIWLIPTAGVLVTSFRPEALADSTGWWTALAHPFRAGEWTLENYRTVLDSGGFKNAFLNSLAVTIPSTVIPVTIAAFAAYAFSWMEFRGRYVMFVLVVGLMVVPLQMALIPILKLYTDGASLFGLQVFPDLNLNGTFLGIWLAHTAFGLPLATYLLRNFIGALPSSIIESAKIDGADHFTIFRRLVVPLSVPGPRRLRDLPVPVGVERPPDRLRLPRRQPRHAGDHDRAQQPLGNARGGLAPAHLGGLHLDGPPARGVLLAPAVLRPGPHGRIGEGMTRGCCTTRHSGTAGTGPLSPQRKWRAIALATLVLAPAIWALLAGLVAIAAHDRVDAPAGGGDRVRPGADPRRAHRAGAGL